MWRQQLERGLVWQQLERGLVWEKRGPGGGGGGGAVLEISGQENERTRSASGDLSKTVEGQEVLWHLVLSTNPDSSLLMDRCTGGSPAVGGI